MLLSFLCMVLVGSIHLSALTTDLWIIYWYHGYFLLLIISSNIFFAYGFLLLSDNILFIACLFNIHVFLSSERRLVFFGIWHCLDMEFAIDSFFFGCVL